MIPNELLDLKRLLASHPPRRALDPNAREAAVALILVPASDGQSELLVIKRARRDGDPWSGQMALPGGRRDPTDSDLLATVRRETGEETSVHIEPSALLGELDDLEPVTRSLPPIVVRPFVFGLPRRPRIAVNDEVDLHLWVRLSELRQSAGEATVRVRGMDLSVEAFILGPHIVWGMTFRIISQFMNLVNSKG